MSYSLVEKLFSGYNKIFFFFRIVHYFSSLFFLISEYLSFLQWRSSLNVTDNNTAIFFFWSWTQVISYKVHSISHILSYIISRIF